MKYCMPCIILCLISCITLQGQEPDHGNDEDHHDHHRNEIGIANSPVYSLTEKELSYELHLHYLYYFPGTRFGVGAGYERIFDEHKHNTLGIACAYIPIGHLNVNLSPGITFGAKEANDTRFSLHLEASYEYEIRNIHIGPVTEFAYSRDDYHISLGLHIGIGF